ncbi:Methylamine util [Synechococcus phage S-PM2]|uniref:Methylamine util n=1 Tax=Synechococcus phage S-PM2 TaxID=238854 RepID=Q5GQM5_BPSYP|nr:methylamine utilization [Synechococcus phage S-PM2]CAF34177.1 Methylamine util [Synechococcus phage S-PM2]CFW42283.1 Methylamine util [Synechococcus phage S-PM2]
MEEEFYSTIKLKSGEEIIAKVSYMSEEDSLLVEKPLLVESHTQKKNGKRLEGFVLKEWIRSSYEDMFIIRMEQVITMSELDDRIKNFYVNNLDSSGSDSDDINVKPNKLKNNGYIGSVEEVKKNLESLFKRS